MKFQSTKRFRKKVIFFVIILLIVVFFIYRKMIKKDKIVYMTVPVKRTNISKTISTTGEVGAIDLTDVGAQASGKIEKIYVELGDDVKKGDPIADIDSTTQLNEVNINKARLKTYNAQLKANKIALKIAKSKYLRGKKLYKQKSMSKETFENLEDQYESAKAKVTETESLIAQTKISLSTAETNLGYTKIFSPIDGTVVSVPVKVGQTVNANMTTPTIVQIANLDEVEVLMEISEGDITSVKTGQKIMYQILGETEQHETVLKSIDPALTLLTNDTYTGVVGSSTAIYYYGRFVIPNKDRKIRIGMTTENVIYVDSADNVLTVPSVAIHSKDNKQYVTVLVAEDKTEEKEITTGVADTLTVEVKSGLNEGDKVVLSQLTEKEVKERAKNGLPNRR